MLALHFFLISAIFYGNFLSFTIFFNKFRFVFIRGVVVARKARVAVAADVRMCCVALSTTHNTKKTEENGNVP